MITKPDRTRYLLKLLLVALLLVPAAAWSQSSSKAPASGQKDYSRFTHKSHSGVVAVPGTSATRELKCDSCHTRAAKLPSVVANPDRNQRLGLSFPGHKACVECHVAQFTTRPLATCNICHETKDGLGARPPQRDFPKRTDYNVFFDAKQHEAHIGYQYADGKKLDCAACHQATQKRMARLIPSHPECYACHTPSSSDVKAEKKSGCVVCHTQVVESVAPRDYRSLAYGARFTHDTHVGYVKGDCAACHSVSGGYNRPGAPPGTIRIRQHVKDLERSGKGCFSCHDGGSHYGRTVFSGEYGPSGQGACTKCHGEELKVTPATG